MAKKMSKVNDQGFLCGEKSLPISQIFCVTFLFDNWDIRSQNFYTKNWPVKIDKVTKLQLWYFKETA